MTKASKNKSQVPESKRPSLISKDGKWKSFPSVPNLMQYLSTQKYYARVKVDGKIIRKNLQTDVWSTAKLRLLDFSKGVREKQGKVQVLGFGKALEIFLEDLLTNTSMKASSKEYRRLCIKKLNRSWPELADSKLTDITPSACRKWASKLRDEIASQYFNNTIATLRKIIDVGIKEYVRQGGIAFENPAKEIARARITNKNLNLPEKDQFHGLVDNIKLRSVGGRHSAIFNSISRVQRSKVT